MKTMALTTMTGEAFTVWHNGFCWRDRTGAEWLPVHSFRGVSHWRGPRRLEAKGAAL